MKKTFLVFILACLSLTIFAQDKSSLLKSALINSTAPDTFLLKDSVLCQISGDADTDSLILADLVRNKYIEQSDADYMKAQMKNFKSHVWTNDSIKNARVIPAAVLPAKGLKPKKATKAWGAYFKNHKSGYYEVSTPLYSRDGKYAVVYVAFQCGANCGNGGATLFKYENGQWKPVKNLNSWRK